MLVDVGALFLLALWGGWVALDGASFAQIMVSRPLVAGAVAGWIAGDPAAGASVGLLLEAFDLTILPVGAARYPESGPAAVVAGGLYAATAGSGIALITAAVFALAWEQISGRSVVLLRQLNARLVPPVSVRRLAAAELERRHLFAVGLDFLRGLTLVLAGIPVLTALFGISDALWMLSESLPPVIVGAAVAGALAGSLQLFGGRARAVLFGVGAVGGWLLLVLR